MLGPNHTRVTPEERAEAERRTLDEFRYCAWRFCEWLRGGGTYTQIDEAVAAGRLVPEWPPAGRGDENLQTDRRGRSD